MGQGQSSVSPPDGTRVGKNGRQDSLFPDPASRKQSKRLSVSDLLILPEYVRNQIEFVEDGEPPPRPSNTQPIFAPSSATAFENLPATQQITADGRRRSLPATRRAPRPLSTIPPVHEHFSSEAPSPSHSTTPPPDRRPRILLADRPPTAWSPPSPTTGPSSPIHHTGIPTTPILLAASPPLLHPNPASSTSNITMKRYFIHYPRCCNRLWLAKCYLATTTPTTPTNLDDHTVDAADTAICPACMDLVLREGVKLGVFTGASMLPVLDGERARRGRGISFKYDGFEALWVQEQLRRWRAEAAVEVGGRGRESEGGGGRESERLRRRGREFEVQGGVKGDSEGEELDEEEEDEDEDAMDWETEEF